MFFSLLRAQAHRRTDAKGLGTWDPEGTESASGWADRVVCRNGYMSSPIGKGAVASRVDVGGRLGGDCSLTCLYSATSVLVPERPRSEETAGASLMILPVALALCLHRMLGLDMDACFIVWQSS